MSAQHTPGPWDMRDDDKRITIGCGLVEGPNGYDVAEVYDDDCPHELAQANARLIAAAPDLLVALEDFDNWFCGFNPDDQTSRMEGRQVVIRARAAVAKARGLA